jgi:hypothetical protein
MAKKPGNGGWIGLGLLAVLGIAAVAARNSGSAEAAHESLVDGVVSELNRQLGKGWGTLALDAIKAALHPDLWSIATVVVDVEQMAMREASSGGRRASGPQKRARVIAKLRSHR